VNIGYIANPLYVDCFSREITVLDVFRFINSRFTLDRTKLLGISNVSHIFCIEWLFFHYE